jgi:DNA (cytosine-5)-methyltransferase 1
LNAADFGIPQLRKRFFLVALRSGAEFQFPVASHAQRHVTCWQAIGPLAERPRNDLPVLGRWGPLLPSIPEGRNYLWHTDRGGGLPLFGWRTRYWSFLLKLAKNAPAWTISAHPAQNAGPFHWANRQLGTSEILRLQTFPPEIVIAGARQDRQRQIGNAVPCLLAEAIGRAIRSQLTGHQFRSSLKLLVPEIGLPIPGPQSVSPPPETYLGLLGKHADHPGTGRGPRPRTKAVFTSHAHH